MSFVNDNETGFSESDINFARQTFIRDCPNGRCSKRKFLACIRKSSLQKSTPSTISIFKTLQSYRQGKQFFSMMFDIYDQNHDGQLDFDEYLYALSAITGANRLRTVETLFRFFDSHNQGYITRQEFNSRKKIAAQFLGQSSTSGIKDNLLYEQAFNTIDLDKDGRITREEFIQWHLKDHLKVEENKPMRRRTRLLKNLSSLVDIRGQIKTSSLQLVDKNAMNMWLETTMNINQQEVSSNNHTDRHLLRIFRRARHRFHQNRNKTPDNQSDADAFISSSIAALIDTDFDFNNKDAHLLGPTSDVDSELLCQSLEAILIETLLELKKHKQRQRLPSHVMNKSLEDDQSSILTRL